MEAASPSQALKLLVTALAFVTVLIPYFALQAVTEMIEALRTCYTVGEESVTFRRGGRRWELHLNDYHTLVVSPQLVLACAGEGEEADALDHVNRPAKQRLLARKLKGVVLADTEPLVRRLKERGRRLESVGRAWVVTPHAS